MQKLNFLFFIVFGLTALCVNAHPVGTTNIKSKSLKPVLADLKSLKTLNIPVLITDEKSQVGFSYITPIMEENLHKLSHLAKKCGSFESLEGQGQIAIQNVESIIQSINEMNHKNELYSKAPYRIASVTWNETVQKAVDTVNESEIRGWVNWLSSFPNRYNRAPEPNKHVIELQAKLNDLLKTSSLPTSLTIIDHNRTPQKTIRVTITGKEHPDEIVVLGAHLDSINGWGKPGAAPGADDNASGSSNLLEALRIVLQNKQPSRTLEFFWYAGEESGLLGSAEIAAKYKADNKSVIGVLQLDMTLFPGEGEFTIGNITDFTSAWLRDYFVSINDVYLKARLVEDQCGYGCSDHASWYRNGYSTLLPFEATLNTMNTNLHTENDVVDSKSDFRHSLVFAKLAVVFALDLANSTLRSPL